MSKPKKVLTTEESVAKYLRIRELGKHCYEQADVILKDLILGKLLRVGRPVQLANGESWVLKNLYTRKTMQVFRSHAIRHYELDLVKPPAKKAKKKGK
jgi:hypothetical protein